MKKNVFAAICVAAFLSAGSVFAAPEFKMSAGIGGLFTTDWTDYKSKDTDLYPQANADDASTAVLGGGVNVWFDATFVEVNIGLVFGNYFFPKEDSDAYKLGGDRTDDVMALRVGALGKYPIALNEKVTLFPALGIDYEMALTRKYHAGILKGKGWDGKDDGTYARAVNGEKSTMLEQYSALWFKAGVGADFALGEKLYLRTEALYGIRLHNKYESDLLDAGNNSDKVSIIGHGLDVKVGVGFKF
ncbi:MAG: hypothetical protein Ta2A_27280 [Treponemataceae bacterium]|nr:MAG: hypothetical protein Ta2A_27280 [Treponemataceae bacterium]